MIRSGEENAPGQLTALAFAILGKEISRMDNNDYFKEVRARLAEEKFKALAEENDLLPVEWNGKPVCRITSSGTIRYKPHEIADQIMENALQRVIRITEITNEYLRLMQEAPPLSADGLEGDYRLLAEFNGVVLAGHQTRFGVQFVTWERDNDRTGVHHGHFMDHHYEAAKQDFVTRSGLVDQHRLFTDEQLVEVYRSIYETLDSDYPITDNRRKLLESAVKQIEQTVCNLEESVPKSNQMKLAEGGSHLGVMQQF